MKAMKRRMSVKEEKEEGDGCRECLLLLIACDRQSGLEYMWLSSNVLDELVADGVSTTTDLRRFADFHLLGLLNLI